MVIVKVCVTMGGGSSETNKTMTFLFLQQKLINWLTQFKYHKLLPKKN